MTLSAVFIVSLILAGSVLGAVCVRRMDAPHPEDPDVDEKDYL